MKKFRPISSLRKVEPKVYKRAGLMKRYKVVSFLGQDGEMLTKEEKFYTYKSARKCFEQRAYWYPAVDLFKYSLKTYKWDCLESKVNP